jgi:uncharacterized glyoxalase superfamily protein PhnB
MTLITTTPILRIFDQAKAKEFYVDFLEFVIDWEHRFGDSLPLYMQVSKDSCVVHLSEHHGDAIPGSALRIETTDISGLNQRLPAKNYRYARPGVETTEWKTREMRLTDPFGNRLLFFERIRD